MTQTTETDSIVIVNEDKVRLLADTLGELPLAADFAAQMTPRIEVDDESAFRAYLWASAICHATKGGLSGWFARRYYKGWDYLLRAFSAQATKNPGALAPEMVEKATEETLRAILTEHSENTEINLRDLARRAQILRITSGELLREFDGGVARLLRRACHTVGGDGGAYALLERLSAFRDALQKKSSAFLMTVHFSGRWKIRDEENILPMIDYHRMRILIRTGCISIRDEEVVRRLRRQESVHPSIESAIRMASMRVCTLMPKLAGMPMFDFDVLLWAHARSCCRHAPICVSRRAENDSFHSYLATPRTDRCVFESWCPGRSDDGIRALWEPIVATEDY